ncbi:MULTISPECIES: metal-dependent hydrolase [Rhodococcus]|uniref:Metal-dependent hydrolase n=1 Tax=Rhodococcus oxybenzonivorans TaxID=1990687 RepID=A0AAE5A8B7_9NOCA|nr:MULTISPECIES: metal-dependent hydrolase [Rhodococcus]MDV7242916.1 metal-dependent hydrolase [Rhodococcus oxybenzonivorans]MDV7267008.1 metal-dependent hydrolase [Rhodococcus oxybenzonivorans]MDV7275320.1 metal-dependent hydrolase [Rhodococcus oxybenzonivorans]MDV7334825.1 metal-dependent hydrolase [Rhodococcus oxybenzonivorans]MDV7344979.1 metal-dependent hydrolase [Rhodococcus oxybenzonivorans]
MTDLQVRKMRFAFADYDVPFVWNEENPAFSSMANAVSFLAIGFEKMIVKMILQTKPLITDPAVAEEADAFMRQEGQHSTAHRQHVKALIDRYPGLQETLDEVIGEFDRLTAQTSLNYRLAYTADLEATFTPVFKLMLDNDSTLFRPGDDRVASLFIWHFVEEVEHRSSALIIFDSVVGSDMYRMRMAPSIFRHVLKVIRIACEGFNRHVPLEDRKVDALSMFASYRRQQNLRKRLPLLRVEDNGPMMRAFDDLPLGKQLTALVGIIRSQLPRHNPDHEKLPALADVWFERYEAGYDVTHWYSADTVASSEAR